MDPFQQLDEQALDMLAYDIADKVFDCGDYPMLDQVDPDQLRKALPAFLHSLGVNLPQPAGNEFARHTCTSTGKPLPYGRKAPIGECKRCDQLRAGAEPREAHPAIRATSRARQIEQDRDACRIAHFAPGGPHATRCAGTICTFGD